MIDVVRCMKFMEKNEKISKEIFNLVKETVTVKEVAEICKKHNPKVTIKVTNDEIPNLGYTLSNKKLLKTGFKFLYNLDESIAEMIQKWSYAKNNMGIEYKNSGDKENIDKRIKKARLSALQSLLKQQQAEFNKSFINKEMDILFEKIGRYKNQYIGRTIYNQSVFTKYKENLISKLKKGTIIKSTNFALECQV